MAEADTTAKQKADLELGRGEVEIAKQSVNSAVALCVICLIAGICFFAFGNNYAGTTFVSAPLLVAVSSVLTTAVKRNKE